MGINKPGLLVFMGVAFFLTLFGMARADFAMTDWEYFKSLSLHGDEKEGLVEFAPDTQIYNHSSENLEDLRIISSGGREAPYALLVDRGERRRSSVKATLRDLGVTPGQYTSFVLVLSDKASLHNELEIETPNKNFQQEVNIEASEDGKEWLLIQEKAQIYDISPEGRSGTSARSTRVSYPVSSAPLLRVRVLGANAPPLEVSGAAVFRLQEVEPGFVAYPGAIVSRSGFSASDGDEAKSTLVIDLGAAGIPTSLIALRTQDTNFFRLVTLEESENRQDWRLISDNSPVFAFNTPLLREQRLYLEYPEAISRYLRLTISNGDDVPIAVDEVLVSGFARRIIFQASSMETYRVFYGNPLAHAAVYDFEKLYPYLVTENLPQGSLGGESLNADYRKRSTEPFTDRYPWVMPLTIGVAALVLGAMLFKIFQQARKAQKEQAL